MSKYPPAQIGRAGEFFVSYYLTLNYFIECVMVDRQDDDIWIKTPNRRIRTLQVKTSTKPFGTFKGLRYRFTTRTGHGADFFAFLALDRKCFLIMPSDLVNHKSTTLAASKFNKVQMHRSIRQNFNV